MKKLFTIFISLLVITAGWGQSFTVYDSDNSDLPHNQVYCIFQDADNNIWFGGQKDALGFARVSYLHPDQTTWTVFDPQDTELALENIEDRVYYIAQDDEGTMFFCTHYGATFRASDGTKGEVERTFDNYTRSVWTDSKGTIYISDRDSAAIHVSSDNGDSWKMWNADTLTMPSGRPEIYDLREDSDGTLWLCTWYGVFYRKANGSWDSVEDIAGYWTYAMTIDPDNNLWVPDNDTQELYKIDSEGAVTIYDSEDAAVLAYPINDLEADTLGNLWLATAGNGIVRLAPDFSYVVFDSTTNESIPEDNVTHLEIFGDEIWASMETKGIVRMDDIYAVTAIGDSRLMPKSHVLHDNYPNPFNPNTQITFDLAKADDVSLKIYNINGKLVSTIAQGKMSAGPHEYSWDGRDSAGKSVASGMYFYQLQAGKTKMTKKMILMK